MIGWLWVFNILSCLLRQLILDVGVKHRSRLWPGCRFMVRLRLDGILIVNGIFNCAIRFKMYRYLSVVPSCRRSGDGRALVSWFLRRRESPGTVSWSFLLGDRLCLIVVHRKSILDVNVETSSLKLILMSGSGDSAAARDPPLWPALLLFGRLFNFCL